MSKYNFVKDSNLKKVEVAPIKVDSCFRVAPLNNIDYPGLKISKVTLLEPEFAKSVIKKKTKRKIDLYLSFLASIIDDDDSSDEASFVLDDLLQFKQTIMIKYSKFLTKSELAKLLKQVAFIESKLRMKVYTLENQANFGKSR